MDSIDNINHVFTEILERYNNIEDRKIDAVYLYIERGNNELFEDDGFLHLRLNNVRLVLYFGQGSGDHSRLLKAQEYINRLLIRNDLDLN